jgi:hypothetical protein
MQALSPSQDIDKRSQGYGHEKAKVVAWDKELLLRNVETLEGSAGVGLV